MNMTFVEENQLKVSVNPLTKGTLLFCVNQTGNRNSCKMDMPRKYIKKTDPKYARDVLIAAMEAVNTGTSIYAASKQFGVPESTIRNRVKRKTPVTRVGAGRSSFLPSAIEQDLADNVILLSSVHNPLTRGEILNTVHEYCKVKQIRNPFSKKADALPGEEFLRGFFKRHPNLVSRKAEALQVARVNCSTKENYSIFFRLLERKIKELNISSPEQIINLDETGYDTSLATTVIARKGAKCVSQKQPGSGKDTFTVVETITANGHIFPPGGPEGTGYLVSKNGWQDKSTFLKYFEEFIKWTTDWKKPILLLFDGHGSHIQYAVSSLALQNDIHILILPAHSSQTLQPLDVAVFGPAKKVWMKIKRNYFKKSNTNITKEVFPSLMKELRDEGGFPKENIIAGFRAAGIWPLNPRKVLDSMQDQDVPIELHVTADEPSNQSINNNMVDNEPRNKPTTAQTDNELQNKPTTSRIDTELQIRPTTSTILNVEHNNETSSLDTSTLTTATTQGKLGEHSIVTFRDVLLKTVTPKSRSMNNKKVRMTFNNKVLTEVDVIKKPQNSTNDLSVTNKRAKKTIKNVESSSESEEISLHDSSDDISLFSDEDQDETLEENTNLGDLELGGYVVAEYENRWYVANILDIKNKNKILKLKYMEPKGPNNFVWPSKNDIFDTSISDILTTVRTPVSVSKGSWA
ncbi:hypothetical protein MML48_1g18716 [Holotrichia oblita]|uniref:Uncharacterized protein n=1 Tax=Holotrichia oblita TaxID=644536 RepID=A0ACB9TSG7_HOLOL|nr:hypothetical protein MML48_1g18716 [Holotrichia oblita]